MALARLTSCWPFSSRVIWETKAAARCSTGRLVLNQGAFGGGFKGTAGRVPGWAKAAGQPSINRKKAVFACFNIRSSANSGGLIPSLECQVFAEERQHEILEAERHIAGMGAGIDFKAVGDPVGVHRLMQPAGVGLQAVLVADIQRDGV